MSESSNVRVLLTHGKSAEDKLRAGLAECAESRSRGITPHVFMMVLEEGCVPIIYRTAMTLTDLSMCATAAAHIAHAGISSWLDGDET